MYADTNPRFTRSHVGAAAEGGLVVAGPVVSGDVVAGDVVGGFVDPGVVDVVVEETGSSSPQATAARPKTATARVPFPRSIMKALRVILIVLSLRRLRA
jgi:hypothetical protein